MTTKSDKRKGEKITRHSFKEILLEDYYSKIGDKVYWNYRLGGIGKWTRRLTPYLELPIKECKVRL